VLVDWLTLWSVSGLVYVVCLAMGWLLNDLYRYIWGMKNMTARQRLHRVHEDFASWRWSVWHRFRTNDFLPYTTVILGIFLIIFGNIAVRAEQRAEALQQDFAASQRCVENFLEDFIETWNSRVDSTADRDKALAAYQNSLGDLIDTLSSVRRGDPTPFFNQLRTTQRLADEYRSAQDALDAKRAVDGVPPFDLVCK